MKTIALIDVDSWIYRAAVAGHMELFGEDALDIEVAKSHFLGLVDQTVEDLEADAYLLCFGDPNHRYFRHDIDPTYKNNRNADSRPKLVEPLYEWARELPNVVSLDDAEAEDTCSILATLQDDPWSGWDLIRVGEDKDLMTVPGKIYRRGQVIEVDEYYADFNNYYQALVGDPVDGYKGCPRVGDRKAKEWLASLTVHTTYEHTFKRGPRKGQTEIRWKSEVDPDAHMWDVVLSCFLRYSECKCPFNEAGKQAELAKILDIWEATYFLSRGDLRVLQDTATKLIQEQLKETDHDETHY